MHCEDAELALLEPPLSADVERHVATCVSCQAFARDLGQVIAAATPAPLTPAEQVALASVPSRTLAQWERRQSAPKPSWLGYALAAGAGALLASAGFWTVRPVREVPVERPTAPIEIAARDPEEPNLQADEGFFEVTWPDLSEGENQ